MSLIGCIQWLSFTQEEPPLPDTGGVGVNDSVGSEVAVAKQKAGILGNPGEFLEAEERLSRQLGAHLEHG